MHGPSHVLSGKGVLGDFTATPRLIPISALGAILGLLGALLSVALLRMIALATNLFFFQRFSFADASPAGHQLGPLVVLVPVVGGLIIGAMARFGSERIRGHGIPEAIESILIRGSRAEPRVVLLKPLSAAISIGSGGPFGAEGPIIMTSGSFGSMIAQFIHLTDHERKTLLVAGAAAGMSATFASPVAATMLAVELLLFEWKPRSLVPVAIASLTAFAARLLLLGQGPIFPVLPRPELPGMAMVSVLASSAAIGVAAGALASLLTSMVYWAEDTFAELPIHWMWWPSIGGVLIGVGGLVFPSALGVGYPIIGELMVGKLGLGMVVGILVVKSLIWSLSLGSGTSGGVLAPLLMLGGALGALLSPLLPDAGAGFWPLIAMGAVLGGTMRAPFTAAIFGVELTHDFGAMVPLLAAAVVAHAFTVLALPRSILTEKVARRGVHLSREYGVDPLEIMLVREVMVEPSRDDRERSLVTIGPEAPLRVAAYRMAETGARRLEVVDAHDGRIVGSLTVEQLLQARVANLDAEHRRARHLDLGRLFGSVRA